jgi:hypothetical protein
MGKDGWHVRSMAQRQLAKYLQYHAVTSLPPTTHQKIQMPTKKLCSQAW